MCDGDGGAEEHARGVGTVHREREAQEVVQAAEVGLEAGEVDVEVYGPGDVDHQCNLDAHESKSAGVEGEALLAEVCGQRDDFALVGFEDVEVALAQG